MEMMLDKKQIWGISLSEYKMGHKTTESNHNVNNICNGGSRSFTKETRVLKMRSTVAGNWKLTMTNWEASSKLILLQLCKTLLKNSTLTILQSFSIWSKSESSIPRCLMSWPQIKKVIILKCCLLLFYTTTVIHFLIRLWHAMKSRFSTTTRDDCSMVRPWRNFKALPKAKPAPEKGHGLCLVVCCPPDLL